jgi:hypothetical protein
MQVDMAEAQDGVLAVANRIRLEVGQQFLLGGFDGPHEVRGHELQLLSHPSSDDLVALIEAHAHGLAVQHLLLEVVLHEAPELGLGGRPPPGHAEALQEAVHHPRRDGDPGPGWTGAPIVPHGADQEEEPAQKEKVDEGLFEEPLHVVSDSIAWNVRPRNDRARRRYRLRARGATPPGRCSFYIVGVYQMGLV